MRIEQKINRALQFISNECNTIDPFEICDRFGIKIVYKNYNVEVMKGCMIKIADDNMIMYINCNLSKKSKEIICAHELGHALLHDNTGNYFHGGDIEKEFEANLFVAYLLLDQSDYSIRFENMSSYILQNAIDELIEVTEDESCIIC